MRILFTTAHSYLPDRAGGSEQSIHELSLELASRDVETAVLCARDGKSSAGDGIIADEFAGYPVYRATRPASAIEAIVERFVPDVAVVQTGRIVPIVNALIGTPIPIVVYFRDVEFHDHGGYYLRNDQMLFLANSLFTATRVRTMFGLDCQVVPSVVRLDDYVVEPSRRRALFIGVALEKGLELVFRIAEARPDIPFSFVESWPVAAKMRAMYQQRAARAGNIAWSRPVADIRSFYAEARLLLVPSIWEESLARVVVEAQASGIPVLASDRGGLPDAVGPGGLIVDPHAPLDDWLAALDRIWSNETEYERLSEAARHHAWRPETAPGRVAEDFLSRLTAFLEGAPGGGALNGPRRTSTR